jgi:hypothetical protein
LGGPRREENAIDENLYIQFNRNETSLPWDCEIGDIKLELGDIATSWTLSPEEYHPNLCYGTKDFSGTWLNKSNWTEASELDANGNTVLTSSGVFAGLC